MGENTQLLRELLSNPQFVTGMAIFIGTIVSLFTRFQNIGFVIFYAGAVGMIISIYTD